MDSPRQHRPSLRMRLRVLRARFSVPALLASADERRVVSALAAAHGGLAIAVISLCAWLTDLPMLFPALGPSAFIVFARPFSEAATPRSVIIGHGAALGIGLAVRCAIEAVSGEQIGLEATDTLPTLLSASVALAGTCFALVRLSAPHAPACATAIIIAVGAVRGWPELFAMATAVVLLTLLAVGVNRLAGLCVPTWNTSPEN